MRGSRNAGIGLYVRFARFQFEEATFVFLLGSGKLALRGVPAKRTLLEKLIGEGEESVATLLGYGTPAVDINRRLPASTVATWDASDEGVSNWKVAWYLNSISPLSSAVCYDDSGEEIVLLGSLPPP